MKSIWKKYKEYLIIILFGLLFLVISKYVIVAFYHKIQTQKNAIQEFLIDREMRNEAIARIGELREQVADARSKNDVLKVVVSKGDIVRLIETIEQLANETHNAVVIESKDGAVAAKKPAAKNVESGADSGDAAKTSDSKPKQAKEKTLQESLPHSEYISITITVTGEYNDILLFIRKLETMPYATDIISLSLGIKQEDALKNRGDLFVAAPKPSDAQNPSGESASAPASPAARMQAVLNTVVYVVEN